MTTMNGWADASQKDVVRLYLGNDKDGAEVLKGSVARAFAWLVNQIHNRVEPVDTLSGWRSRAYNTSIGGANNSNHISGTAVDVNGARHPYEKNLPWWRPYTTGFSNKQAREIRRILAEADGIFYWGADFPKGLRDAMHFELHRSATPAKIQAFLKKVEIMATLDNEDKAWLLDTLVPAVWAYKNPSVTGGDKDVYAHVRNSSLKADNIWYRAEKYLEAKVSEVLAVSKVSAAEATKAAQNSSKPPTTK